MLDEKVKAITVIESVNEGIKIVDCLVGIVRGYFTVTYIDDNATFTIGDKDWYRTPEAAIARAEAMRKEKIAVLERQIEHLKKLEFKV